MTVRRWTAVAVAGVLAATTGAGVATGAEASGGQGRGHSGGDGRSFHRTATYPVFQNRPAGEDPATPTVAEISAVTPDGRTLLSTDALARRIGFLDISDPDVPKGLGTL